MRRTDLWTGIVLAAVGLLTIFVVIPWQIAPGPQGYMSPRLVPTMMMALITGLAVLMVIRNLRPQPGEVPERILSNGEVGAALRLSAVLALALALYHLTAPLMAGIAVVLGSLLVLGERRPLVLIALPTMLMLLIWLLFYRVLGTAIV